MEFRCIFLDIHQIFIVVDCVLHEGGHGEESIEYLTKGHQTREDDHENQGKYEHLREI